MQPTANSPKYPRFSYTERLISSDTFYPLAYPWILYQTIFIQCLVAIGYAIANARLLNFFPLQYGAFICDNARKISQRAATSVFPQSLMLSKNEPKCFSRMNITTDAKKML